MRKTRLIIAALAAVLSSMPAAAQTVGGNVSLAVSGTTGNIKLPQPTNGANSYPAVLLEYALGATQEIFYNFGTTSAVTATAPSLPTTQGSPALPANGICVFPGPDNFLAAITATSTSTLRVTQLSTCPPR